MKCQLCSFENPEGRIYCGKCGSILFKTDQSYESYDNTNIDNDSYYSYEIWGIKFSYTKEAWTRGKILGVLVFGLLCILFFYPGLYFSSVNAIIWAIIHPFMMEFIIKNGYGYRAMVSLGILMGMTLVMFLFIDLNNVLSAN